MERKERYIIQDAEAWNKIDAYDKFTEALDILNSFIEEDEKNWCANPNYYEILDQETGKLYDRYGDEK